MQAFNRFMPLIFAMVMILPMGCSTSPEKIVPGKDSCAECKMSIADPRFGAEIVTKKGRIFKFDDLHCLAGFLKQRRIELTEIAQTLAVNYNHPDQFIKMSSAHLLVSSELKTPMGSHAAAFTNKAEATTKMEELPGSRITDWSTLYNVLVK